MEEGSTSAANIATEDGRKENDEAVEKFFGELRVRLEGEDGCSVGGLLESTRMIAKRTGAVESRRRCMLRWTS